MSRPIHYLQTDPRWKKHNYSADGESRTIGSSGCGPAAAAMVIATLKDQSVTPVSTAEWSMAHGYKALGQGTYYTYFIPQFAAYGIACKRLNTANLYGQSFSAAHTEAQNALKGGDWVIACMGKGNWTSSGHFILLYAYKDGTVYINDPASTASARSRSTWALFARQVKYLWAVTVPDSFKTIPDSDIASPPAPSETPYTKTQFVRDVQSAIGARPDGIAGPETLSRTLTISRNRNRRHAVVKYIQRYLNASGYPCGAEDGIAGVKFDAAVKAFQRANDCVADGEITKGKKTWKKLLA